MSILGKRIGLIIGGVMVGLMFFSILQMLLPFPIGFQLGVTFFGIIVGICIIIAFVVIKSEKTKENNKSALSILKERYAKGEITQEEFGQMKKDLI